MLTGADGPPRPADWGAAAERCAATVRVSVVPALTLPPHGELRGVGRDPRQPYRYEVAAARGVPGTAGRIAAALRHEAARGGPFDLLHVHRPGTDRYAPRVAGELGVPYVVSEHDARWFGPVGGRELRRAARLFRDAAAVLPVSDSLLLRLGDLALPGHHRLLPVPLDEDALPAVPARARITQDAVRIVAAGPLRAGSGWEELADAFATAHAEDPRLRLRIIGDGPCADALRARLDGAGTAASAVGFTADTGRAATLHALAHADLCAYPHPVAAFGETALDALACGTQVVATPTGALPELVAHDGGVLVARHDPALLAPALLEAAAGLPRHHAPTLAHRVRHTFGLPTSAQRLAAVYTEVSGRA
jgi:glycosyltransferase involved in cell wall biosynthesis